METDRRTAKQQKLIMPSKVTITYKLDGQFGCTLLGNFPFASSLSKITLQICSVLLVKRIDNQIWSQNVTWFSMGTAQCCSTLKIKTGKEQGALGLAVGPHTLQGVPGLMPSFHHTEKILWGQRREKKWKKKKSWKARGRCNCKDLWVIQTCQVKLICLPCGVVCSSFLPFS